MAAAPCQTANTGLVCVEVARISARRSSLGPRRVCSWGRRSLSLHAVARTRAMSPRRTRSEPSGAGKRCSVT